MDTKALRKDIIEKVKNSLEDDVILDIARLIDADESYQKIIFSEDQKNSIKNSIREYEEGKFITNEVAEEEIQKWLRD